MNSPITTLGFRRSNVMLPGDLKEVGGEQHQGREAGRANSVRLGDRLGRVSDCVEFVGDVANLLG